MIDHFHFLRPWWLLAILPALVLAWEIRRRSDSHLPWKGIVADHLLPYLIRGGKKTPRRGPVLALVIGWVTTILVMAGPTWKQVPSPFANDIAPLAIVMRVAPSMETEDIAPSRFSRSLHEIHDLLSLRGKSKSCLIAYAGSAHLVMPPTTDAAMIETFASALSPKIMPIEGDSAADAMMLADRTLQQTGGESILWVADGIAPEQNAALKQWRKSTTTRLSLLAPVTNAAELNPLKDSAAAADAKFIPLAADDSDIAEIDRISKLTTSAPGGDGERWQDSGYWLTPWIASLLLPFFRKGWMPPIAARS